MGKTVMGWTGRQRSIVFRVLQLSVLIFVGEEKERSRV